MIELIDLFLMFIFLEKYKKLIIINFKLEIEFSFEIDLSFHLKYLEIPIKNFFDSVFRSFAKILFRHYFFSIDAMAKFVLK